MKQPGLDDRHRDKDGQIQKKRNDTQNQNLPGGPIPGFKSTTTLKDIRQQLGLPNETSEKDVRDYARKRLNK